MTLDNLLTFVNFIINKKSSGNPYSIEELNINLPIAQQRYYNSQYSQYQRTRKITDSLEIFASNKNTITIDYNGQYSLPANYFHCTGLGYIENINGTNYYRKIKQITDGQYYSRMGSSLLEPTSKYPIAIFSNNKIQFEPLRSAYGLFSYLRNPTTPYYDYYTDDYDNKIYKVAGASKTDIILRDLYSQLSGITLNGVTDDYSDSGKLYGTLIYSTVYTLNLYSDEERTQLVASGNRNTSSGSITISQSNNSGISGSVTLAYTQDDSDIIFISVPISQTVELEWRYDDQIKIAGYLLEMIAINLKDIEVFKYAEMFNKIER